MGEQRLTTIDRVGGDIDVPSLDRGVLDGDFPPPTPEKPLTGECLEAEPPALDARARVRWMDAQGNEVERWLPLLRHIAVREGDRLLLLQPLGWPTPLVAGVINGFERRVEAPRPMVRSIALHADEAVVITDHEGRPLLEFARSATGLKIRPVASDVEFDVPGALKIRADRVAVQAERGDVHLRASDCVIAEGELIKLN